MWEIISNKTCCFIQKPFIIYPNKFVDGESCVYYETLSEFKEKLNYYLNNKDECIRIGKNGYEHTKKYHTGKVRVQYMLNVIKGIPWQEA
jgi:spore maturation protein CgeB